jgi:CDP-paratose 2-epimerase
LHPRDLAALISEQMRRPEKAGQVANVSGGTANSMSLAQLSRWCAGRFGPRQIASDPTGRRFDVPWLVLDSARAEADWKWRPETKLEQILEEIAVHAEQHPEWLDISSDA